MESSSGLIYLWTNMHEAALGRVYPTLFGAADVQVRIWPKESPPPRGPGRITLALGGERLQTLKGLGEVASKATLGSLRGKPIQHPEGGATFVSYSPGMIDRDYELLPEVRWDGVLALRYARTGSTAAQLGTYEEVTDLREMIAEIEARFAETSRAVPVTHDLEWAGGDPWNPESYIVASSWTVRPGRSRVLYFEKGQALTPRLHRQLKWLFTTNKISLCGTNHKSDSHWVRLKWGLRITNYKFDVLLGGGLLDENRSNGLKPLTCEYVPEMGGYDAEFDEKYDKGHMELIPRSEVVTYGGADTDATARVRTCVVAGLREDRGLLRFYKTILHPAALAFEEVEQVGIEVDVKSLAGLGHELMSEDGATGYVPDKLAEFRALLPPKVKAKYIDNLRPSRPALIQDLFFSPLGFGLKPTVTVAKSKKWVQAHQDLAAKWKLENDPSTSLKDHLIRFFGDKRARPVIELMRDISSAEKTRSTYVDGWLGHLRADGRFHPEYFLFKKGGDDEDTGGGTNTGRTSAKNPAWQTLPKRTKWAKALRKCFPAPPGKAILQWDYKQGELKIAACLANELTMLAAYAAGQDLHSLTAAKLGGMSVAEFLALEKTDPARYELMRSQAKAGNFGLLYGMGVEGFMLYAFSNYGLVLTYAQAEKIHNDFFDLYSGLHPWHDAQREYVRKWECVRSPLGRIRHLPMIRARANDVRSKAERQAINSPVQSTLSDLCLWAIAEMHRQYGTEELQIFGMTHDSISAYVPAEDALLWAKRGRDVMENLPIRETFGWEHQLPFTVDAEVSYTNLADLKKVAA